MEQEVIFGRRVRKKLCYKNMVQTPLPSSWILQSSSKTEPKSTRKSYIPHTQLKNRTSAIEFEILIKK